MQHITMRLNYYEKPEIHVIKQIDWTLKISQIWKDGIDLSFQTLCTNIANEINDFRNN